MNSHTQPLFLDQVGSRSPGAHRQQHNHQTLNRQVQRSQMDAYGNLGGPSYLDDHIPTNRYDRMGLAMQGADGTSDFYNMGGAQSWNPNAFASGGLGGTNAFGGFGTIGGTTGGRMRPPNRPGRANLPNTWLDPQSQMAPVSGFGGLGLDTTASLRPQNFMSDAEDDLIPTAIVIKNIPFAVKKEALVDVMSNMNLPLPYAFNYHFDNGVFRGLAFANFTSPEETSSVINALNHYELSGRKLRVEYKKMLPQQERERIEREKRERRGQLEEQHRPMNHTLTNQPSMSSLSSHIAASSPSPISTNPHHKPDVDLNNPDTLGFYNQLFSFKNDEAREALVFPSTLTSGQRRTVHTLAHNLQLYHVSQGHGEQRQVHVTRAPLGNNMSPPIPQLAHFHTDPSRRVLNRAATTDFSEARGGDAFYGTLRPQQSGGYLSIPDSPSAFGNRDGLRAAKSFADLRSYSPSPVPSSASFPNALQSNAAQFRNLQNTANAAMAAQVQLGPSGSSALSQAHDENSLLNGFANLNVGTNIGPGINRGSPRDLRGMMSFEQQQGPSTAPIGSNRHYPMGNLGDGPRERNHNMPIRQPSIPSDRGGTAFSRNRQNGHQSRGSDETRHSKQDVIHE